MKRHFPGVIEVDGREFFYLAAFPGEGFDELLDGSLAASPELPLPTWGGAIEEKAWIRLDGGTKLLGISYKGDLGGWQAKLVAFCQAKNRLWGIASRKRLVLSDGTKLELARCEVSFDD